MRLKSYLFTINKNSSYKLNEDELKDLNQELDIYFNRVKTNDYYAKKTVLSYFIRAVDKKKKQEEIINSGVYLINNEPGEHEIQIERQAKIKQLDLTKEQQKIISLLVEGYTYPEIRKKLRLKERHLRNQIYLIRKQNQSKTK